MTKRSSVIDIRGEEFRKVGHDLVDQIANYLETIAGRPVTGAKTAAELHALLEHTGLPVIGKDAGAILTKAANLLFENSLSNGHPKFLGYITSSPSPLGALADLLASSVNPNVGAFILSPMATTIEKQTIRWLAEFVGISPDCAGLLVSGGNMANFTAFLAARTAKGARSIKTEGLAGSYQPHIVYCSKATHAWVEKAAVLFGIGTNNVRWIGIDENSKMQLQELEQSIVTDLKAGFNPFLVIANAGDVSTGAVDDLKSIASLCKIYNLWFHVDGAYGVVAAALPELAKCFEGIREADSIALDPHKWLYSPLEAGCVLVKDPNALLNAYSTHPPYYNFSSEEVQAVNYYEYGFQNSRGFRALKVWMGLQQAGLSGYQEMIREDIRLSKLLFDLAQQHPELEAITQNLSIATLRYVPEKNVDLKYLNTLNEVLLNSIQRKGDVFLSNAMINGMYCLRACIVNFRTSDEDIEQIIDILVKEGRKIANQLADTNNEVINT